MIVLAVSVLSLSAGCARTESRRLAHAADSYAVAVNLAADARRAGLINDVQAARLETYRQVARSALDAWRDAYHRKRAARSRAQAAPETGSFEAAFRAALHQMQCIYQPGGHDGPDGS
jgi:uncharacterized protein YdbL (DUF1318 family)